MLQTDWASRSTFEAPSWSHSEGGLKKKKKYPRYVIVASEHSGMMRARATVCRLYEFEIKCDFPVEGLVYLKLLMSMTEANLLLVLTWFSGCFVVLFPLPSYCQHQNQIIGPSAAPLGVSPHQSSVKTFPSFCPHFPPTSHYFLHEEWYQSNLLPSDVQRWVSGWATIQHASFWSGQMNLISARVFLWIV